jgi:hypothetical protein
MTVPNLQIVHWSIYAVKIAGENKECEIIIMHVILSFPAVPFSSAKHGRINAPSPSYLHDIYEKMESNADKILDKLASIAVRIATIAP